MPLGEWGSDGVDERLNNFQRAAGVALVAPPAFFGWHPAPDWIGRPRVVATGGAVARVAGLRCPRRQVWTEEEPMKKRTIQVSLWSDDDEAVAAFINAVRLGATAAFGTDNQEVVFSGPGVKKVRSALEAVEWRSANVSGRMKTNS